MPITDALGRDASFHDCGWYGFVVLSVVLLVCWLVVSMLRRRRSAALFVSYPGLCIDAVRPVVEAILARGHSVWFDEYSISLNDASDKTWLWKVIERGLAASKLLIVFDSVEYWASQNCKREYEAYRKRLRAVRKLPLCIGATNIFEQMSELSGINLKPCSAPVLDNFQRFEAKGFAYWWPMGGWQAEPITSSIAAGDVAGPHARCCIDGVTVHLSIVVGAGGLEEYSECGDDDFLVVSRRYARGYIERYDHSLRIRCHGIHRFYYCGRRQLALTYRYAVAKGLWIRRYSIVTQVDSRLHEFVIVFGVEGGFRDLCRIGSVLDDTARALRVTDKYPDPPAGGQSPDP